MKKLLVMLLAAVACASIVACKSSKPTEAVPETEPEEIVDPVEEAKEKLAEAYESHCDDNIKSRNATLGSDKMSLIIDTDYYNRGWDSYEDEAMAAIRAVNTYLGIPSSVLQKMSSTRALDGMQSQNCGAYTVTWNYHPDNGLQVIYEVNP